MATKPPDLISQQLQHQTWVLKVSIHCEGCKKKVKKVLQSIEGVYKTEVDSQQHKVTVTGNVEAQTLIKKLIRAGKHAELCPAKPEDGSIPSAKPNNDKHKPEDAKDAKVGGADNHVAKNMVPNNGDNGSNDQISETETEDPSIGDESKNAAGDNGKGGKKKKKKKINKNSDNNPANNLSVEPQPAEAGLPSPAAAEEGRPIIPPVNHSPPIEHLYPYIPMYYNAPHPQAYGISYNTVNPSAAAAYYAPSMHAHVYSHAHRYQQMPPPSVPVRGYNDCYDRDDNEGGCSVM